MRKSHLFGLSLPGLILVFLLDAGAVNQRAGFIFDDLPVIVLNPQLRSPSFLEAMSFNPFRATAYATFWAQIRSIHGRELGAGDAGIFRFVNLVLHWLAGMALAGLGLRLFPARKYLPVAAAYLFWLNPVFLEAQNLVLGRTEIMATIFYLLALGFYLGRKRPGLSRLGFFIALILALFSKETAATLPAAALLLSLYKSERPKKPELIAGSVIVIIAIILRLAWPIELARSPRLVPAWPEYFLAQNWILWLGAVKTIFPLHLNFDYQLEFGNSMGIVFLLSNLAALAAIVFVALRKWNTGFLVLVWPLLYLPLMAVPLADNFRESRLYLSSAWLILLVSLVFSVALSKRKILSGIGLAAVLVCFILLGFARAQTWSSGESLWKDAVTKSPKKFRPLFNYGNALRRKLELDRAKRAYLWAKSLEPDNLEVDRNLFLLEQAQKNPALIQKLKSQLSEP